MKAKNFLSYMIYVLPWKKQQQEIQARKDAAFQRVIFSASFLLVAINLLLAVDVYVLPTRATYDSVRDLASLHTRGPVEEKLTTRNGRRLYMEYTSGKPGTPLMVHTTYVFDIVQDIRNMDTGQLMVRRMDGYAFSRFFCFPFLFFGLLCLLNRKKTEGDRLYYFAPVPVLVTLQVLLLIL